MSKLREHLNVNVFPFPGKPKLSTIPSMEITSYTLPMDEKYVVEARIRKDVIVAHELIEDNPNIVDYVIKQIKDAIVEEIMGEFRKPLMELQFAIYRSDQEQANKLLNKLMEQMYG